MKMSPGQALQLVKTTASEFGEDECTTQAAALAYSIVFALPALLVLILKIVGAVVSRDQVQHALSGQFGNLMGHDGARMVQTMLAQAKKPGGGVIGTILGIVTLVLGATGAFLALQNALDRAWDVKPDPKAGGIKTLITKRVLSLGMVLGVAFLLLVSLALTSAITAVGGMMGAIIPGGSAVVAGILQTVISLAVITLLFSAMFKVLPDAEIAWKDVWVGGLATAVLFEVGKWAIGLYLGHSNPGQAYGAAGSLAVILVWIYYTSMIVLFGAEFTQVWATARGGGIRPEHGAVWRDDAEHPGGASPGGAASGGAAKEAGGRSRPAVDDDRGDARGERHPQRTVGRTAATSEVVRERLAAQEAREGAGADQSGDPHGGGVGRREEVGGSGVYPLSSGAAPADADVRAATQWGEPDDRNGTKQ